MKNAILLFSLSLISAQAFAVNLNLNCASYYTLAGQKIKLTIMVGDTAGALVVTSSPEDIMASGSIPKTGEKVSLTLQTLPERIVLMGRDRYNVAGSKLVILPANSNAAPTINVRNRSYNVSIEKSELQKSSGIIANVQVSQEAYQGASDPISNMQFSCAK